MSLVRCSEISPGLRDSEILATITDFNGRRHSIRVEKDFLTPVEGVDYLPIGIIHVDSKTEAVLIEFPHEPETGINRIWIQKDQLCQPDEIYA